MGKLRKLKKTMLQAKRRRLRKMLKVIKKKIQKRILKKRRKKTKKKLKKKTKKLPRPKKVVRRVVHKLALLWIKMHMMKLSMNKTTSLSSTSLNQKNSPLMSQKQPGKNWYWIWRD